MILFYNQIMMQYAKHKRKIPNTMLKHTAVKTQTIGYKPSLAFYLRGTMCSFLGFKGLCIKFDEIFSDGRCRQNP